MWPNDRPKMSITCSKCSKLITERMLTICDNRYWHSACLTCQMCGDNSVQSLYSYRGSLICKQDYYKLNCVCKTCSRPIGQNDLVVRLAKNFGYMHDKCVYCGRCRLKLGTGDRYMLTTDNTIVCQKCIVSVQGPPPPPGQGPPGPPPGPPQGPPMMPPGGGGGGYPPPHMQPGPYPPPGHPHHPHHPNQQMPPPSHPPSHMMGSMGPPNGYANNGLGPISNMNGGMSHHGGPPPHHGMSNGPPTMNQHQGPPPSQQQQQQQSQPPPPAATPPNSTGSGGRRGRKRQNAQT